MDTIPIPIPGQAAAPGAIDLSAPAATAPDAVVLAGTSGGGSSTPAPGVVPIAAPAPSSAPGVVPLDTPQAVEVPVALPIAVNGSEASALVNQTQLAQTVAQITALVAAGTKPVIEKPDGSKVELTLDENNNLGEAPVEE